MLPKMVHVAAKCLLLVLAEKTVVLFSVRLVLSSIANQLSHIAIGWHIYEFANSPLQLGLTGVFCDLLVMVFSFTGVLADRVDRRRLLIFNQTVAVPAIKRFETENSKA